MKREKECYILKVPIDFDHPLIFDLHLNTVVSNFSLKAAMIWLGSLMAHQGY